MPIPQEYLEIQEILKKAYNEEMEYLEALEKIEAIVNPGPPLHWGKRLDCLIAAFRSFCSDEFHFVFDYECNQAKNYVHLLVFDTKPEQWPRFKEIANELTERFGIKVWINLSFWIEPEGV
jgi:hypothetical protein